MEQSPWETNRFAASQEIPPFYGTQSFITTFTSACHLSLSWAHTSGSIQVWGNSLYFITWYVFYGEELFTPHPTRKLEYYPLLAVCNCSLNIFTATVHIRGCSSICNWGLAMPWWQGPTYLGYIAHYDGFILTNDSEDVLSVCIISNTACFLLDIFHS